MATGLTSTPAFPIAGDTVELTVTGSDFDAFALEITTVPPTSGVPLGFLLAGDVATPDQPLVAATAQAAIEGGAGDSFVTDVAGDYVVKVWEFHRFEGGGGAFLGDPVDDPRLVLQVSSSLTIEVGIAMVLPIVTTDGDGADLQVGVVGSTVRSAALVNVRSERARLASLESSVVAALAALVSVAVSAIGPDLVAATNDLRTAHEAHRIFRSTVHQKEDFASEVLTPPAHSVEDAISLLNDINVQLRSHLRNSNLEANNDRWHQDDQDDTLNAEVIGGASDTASLTVLQADLRYRVYERHRQQEIGGTPPFDDPSSHDDADATNVLTATTLLDDVIVAFLDAIVDTTPTAPTGESQGVHDASNRYGFTP